MAKDNGIMSTILNMRDLFRFLRKLRYQYEPLIEIRLSKDRLIGNFRALKCLAPSQQLAPVLKSNAYGHGLVQIAKIMEQEKPPFFVVDSYFEALNLRNEKISSPILIIGFTRTENILRSELKNTAFILTTFEQIKLLSSILDRPKKFHLKIDTGMNRQGIKIDELLESLHLIKQNKNMLIEGVCSHLAMGYDLNNPITQKQIRSWNENSAKVQEAFPDLLWKHSGATASHVFTEKIDANVSRSGIGLYGISSNEQLRALAEIKPVLSMHSIVSGIKEIKTGENVGYDNFFTADRNMTVATVPVGYYEGVDKRLTNKGYFLINDKNCPIVGRVSMNITIVDVSGSTGLLPGFKVTVISDNPVDLNSIESIAKIAGTSPYEILVHIPEHIRRVVF